jgi:flagellin
VAFTINTNIASLQAQEYLRQTGDFQNKTIGRVTSGLRITAAGDDAAGLAIANSFRSDQAVITQGVRNANDGLATLQTIDGGINNISKLLDRARSLASQSASGTFTGSRAVLNNEFQNVLAEINRQAQSIGLVSGGDFAQSLSVFIGGGRAVTGGTSETVNGAVTVDLSSSLLDTTSLGLAANGVAGTRDLRSGTAYLSTAKAVGTAANFSFKGLGFTGTAVTVAIAAGDWANINNEDDLVTVLNAAIQTAGETNSSFAAAGVKASIDTDGKLTFASESAVQVSAANAQAQTIFTGAATAKYSTGTHKVALAWVDISDAGAGNGDTSQRVSIDYKDSDGVVQNVTVDLAVAEGAGDMDIDEAVTALNATLSTTAGNDVYAVKDGTNIAFLSAGGTSFQVNTSDTLIDDAGVITASTDGLAGGAAAVTASSSTGTASASDISTISTAVSAVTTIAAASVTLGTVQANVGKAQNQLTFAISLASTQLTNLAASESRIRDADLAMEAANLTKAQILQQAGVAALAQANSAPQAILSLLRG